MKRLAGLLLALACLAASAQSTEAPKKVLRLAFRVAETSFDPAKVNDIYSRTITPHIFEALYQYDHLARPAKIKPLLAVGMPRASADFRVWTVNVRPGIYFADDPAFKGKKREVVARSSATPTRSTAVRTGAFSRRRSASSAWRKCARPRSTAGSPSTTTRRSRA